MKKFFVVVFLVFVFVSLSNAGIFVKKEKGVFIITNAPSTPDYIKVLGDDPAEQAPSYETPYDPLIIKYSKKYNVDISLVKAIIKAESDFKHFIVNPETKKKEVLKSSKGAIGIMQVMPATAKKMGINNVYSVENNIKAGVKYLSYLLRKYNSNLVFVIAAYNAGPDAVDKYKGIPPYPETRQFVAKVVSFLKGGGDEKIKKVKKFLDKKGNIILTNIY